MDPAFSIEVNDHNLKKAKYLASIFAYYQAQNVTLVGFDNVAYSSSFVTDQNFDEEEKREYLTHIHDQVIEWSKLQSKYIPSATIKDWSNTNATLQFIDQMTVYVPNFFKWDFVEVENDLFNKVESCLNENTNLIYEISWHHTRSKNPETISFNHNDFTIDWDIITED
jgi:hypothetical protein